MADTETKEAEETVEETEEQTSAEETSAETTDGAGSSDGNAGAAASDSGSEETQQESGSVLGGLKDVASNPAKILDYVGTTGVESLVSGFVLSKLPLGKQIMKTSVGKGAVIGLMMAGQYAGIIPKSFGGFANVAAKLAYKFDEGGTISKDLASLSVKLGNSDGMEQILSESEMKEASDGKETSSSSVVNTYSDSAKEAVESGAFEQAADETDASLKDQNQVTLMTAGTLEAANRTIDSVADENGGTLPTAQIEDTRKIYMDYLRGLDEYHSAAEEAIQEKYGDDMEGMEKAMTGLDKTMQASIPEAYSSIMAENDKYGVLNKDDMDEIKKMDIMMYTDDEAEASAEAESEKDASENAFVNPMWGTSPVMSPSAGLVVPPLTFAFGSEQTQAQRAHETQSTHDEKVKQAEEVEANNVSSSASEEKEAEAGGHF